MGISEVLRLAGPLVAGALSALVVVRWAGDRPQAAPSTQVERSSKTSMKDKAAAQDTAAECATRRPFSVPAAASAAAQDQTPAMRPREQVRKDRAQRIEADQQEQRMKLEAHNQEPRDENWRRVAEGIVADGFRQEPRFLDRLRNVDCRTTSCVGTLSWPNAGVAAAEILPMAEMNPAFRCHRSVYFDPKDDPNSPTTGSIIYDCSERLDSDSQELAKGR